jgi:hypothetical protein
MNESDKKRLTEWLGECNHEFIRPALTISDMYQVCAKCGNPRGACRNRIFTDPADFFAVFDKLVELKQWPQFKRFAHLHYGPDDYGVVNDFTEFLLSRTESGEFRLCQLTAEWLAAQAVSMAYYCQFCGRHLSLTDGVYIHDDLPHPEDYVYEGEHHVH